MTSYQQLSIAPHCPIVGWNLLIYSRSGGYDLEAWHRHDGFLFSDCACSYYASLAAPELLDVVDSVLCQPGRPCRPLGAPLGLY
jgi:hypothetical protein